MMDSNDIRLLLLDVHGVLLNRPFPELLSRIARQTSEAESVLTRRWHRDLREPAWRGELGEAELWRRLGAVGPGSSWREPLERLASRGPAADCLPEWHARVPVWILSNHRSDWLLPRLERFGLAPFVDRTLVSDRIGALKPEPAAFRPALETVSDPRQILFVDDQASNVAVARHLGLSAILAGSDDWVGAVDDALSPGERINRAHPEHVADRVT